MREIKFRGKNDFNDEWYYGYLFLNKTEDGYCVGYLHDYADVIESTVGQFTGLLDCNGKEIYEGDIIKLDDEVYAVTWDNYSGCWSVEFGDMGLALLTQYSTKNSTIIGNVHDNPELLEGKDARNQV